MSLLNQSSVYFSNNYFANQAAINPVFNFIHALVKRDNGANPFNYMPTLQAKDLVKEIFSEKVGHYSVLNSKKPNVLLITWESLTAKALNKAYCNGFEVLPTFKKISQEGLYFPNTYASGDRSDKGLIAILSGYPAQPIASIMTIPQKTAKLPVISADLKRNGYFTAWYYGGEPEFANIKTYISHGQFDKVVTKADYPSELTDTKWGANDKTTFNRLLTDLRTMKQPFFVNTFTLSSHEPFEIPNHDVIKGKDEKSKFLNALNYTDTQLGWFLAEIKKEPWYANTLVIIIADHGHRLPETIDKLEEFQIPMLWLGGALAQKAQVRPESVSQNDLAKSLLNQLNVPSGDYIWSKDLFSSTYKSSAYFAYRNGFGFINSQNHVIFDNDTKKIRQSKAQNTQILLKQGQAMVQETYADFLSK